MNEPAVTWNLILCVIAFPSLGWFIRRLFDDMQKQAVDRYALLHEELRETKACVAGIKRDLNNKVDEELCQKKSEEKWARINKHRHTDDGSVVIIP